MNLLPYRLFICGKGEIDGFANAGLTHLLSLEDPGTPKRTPAWFRGVHEQLHFHDVESDAEARSLRAVAPCLDKIKRALRFGRTCLAQSSSAQPVTLLVHCYAGASRSPATAYALACQALGQGREREALDYVLRLRPQAIPNALVVQLADELLAAEGRLVKATAPLRANLRQQLDEWIAGHPRKEF
jgi:predicted protein tyrosine phosphatase